MTATDLRRLKHRAARKRALIVRRGTAYVVVDAKTDEEIATCLGLPELEDKIRWLDSPEVTS